MEGPEPQAMADFVTNVSPSPIVICATVCYNVQ